MPLLALEETMDLS